MVHPSEFGLAQKLAYEHYLLELFEPGDALADLQPHFSTVGALGEWWLARFELDVDVVINDERVELTVVAAKDITGVALDIPAEWQLLSVEPGVSVSEDRLLIDQLSAGSQKLIRFTLPENAL